MCDTIGRNCVVNLFYQKPDSTFSISLRVVVVVLIVPEYYCYTDELFRRESEHLKQLNVRSL